MAREYGPRRPGNLDDYSHMYKILNNILEILVTNSSNQEIHISGDIGEFSLALNKARKKNLHIEVNEDGSVTATLEDTLEGSDGLLWIKNYTTVEDTITESEFTDA